MSKEEDFRHSNFKAFKQLDLSWTLMSEQHGKLEGLKNLDACSLVIRNYNSGEVYAELNAAGVITKKS